MKVASRPSSDRGARDRRAMERLFRLIEGVASEFPECLEFLLSMLLASPARPTLEGMAKDWGLEVSDLADALKKATEAVKRVLLAHRGFALQPGAALPRVVRFVARARLRRIGGWGRHPRLRVLAGEGRELETEDEIRARIERFIGR